ncbi:MAG: alpha/beta hydrolase [Proteobacteria bacterium]|nr:alpha/beta hydrolase [Pseudomonadota bacterium]
MSLPQNIQKLYPYKGHRIDVHGGSLHFLDEGESDTTILALHGNPTWSFYWRSIVEAFHTTHRVVIPDHIGCGLSDKPQDWTYRLEDHIQNVESLVDHLQLKKIHLLVHDWGGAIGMGFASRHPELIQSLTITNTAAFHSQEIPWSIASCRIPIFGSIAVRGFNAFAGIATWRASAKGLSKDVKSGLIYPYKDWKNRIATLRFVEDIPLKPKHPSYATLTEVEKGLDLFKNHPMLILWGDQDFCFTPNFRKIWEQRFPNAQSHAWKDVGHYVMEDAPERSISLMKTFWESVT